MAHFHSSLRLKTRLSAFFTACALTGAGAQASTDNGLAMVGEARLKNLTFTLVDLDPNDGLAPSVEWLPLTYAITNTPSFPNNVDYDWQVSSTIGSSTDDTPEFGARLSLSAAELDVRRNTIANRTWGDLSVGKDSRTFSESGWPSLILGRGTGMTIRGTWHLQGRHELDALLAPIASKDSNPDAPMIEADLRIGLRPYSQLSSPSSIDNGTPSGSGWGVRTDDDAFNETGSFMIGVANRSLDDLALLLELSASVTLNPNFGGYVPPNPGWPSPPVAIPEPSTWALMTLGLFGVAGAHRRKRLLT